MNFTAVFCCYILLPYFASLVSPPQEAITCNAGAFNAENSSTYWNKNVLTKVFIQKLNHYNFTDARTWFQTYIVNDKYYRGNGVVFLSIGTDEDITLKRMQTGRWIKYCEKAKALCVGIQHRNFDNSVPFEKYDNGVYKYSNNEQALADVAWFIHNFKTQKATNGVLPEKLTWAAYGRSQGGTLATLMRVKFPHLVQATLSLGAPLVAKREFDEFYKLIYEMFEFDKDLKETITSAYERINTLIQNNDYRILAKKFNFCCRNVLDNEHNRNKNIEIMYLIFARVVASIMQYGEDVKRFLKKEAYKKMIDPSKETIDRFADLMKWVLKENGIICLQIDYTEVIKLYLSVYDHRQFPKSYAIEYPFAEIFGDEAALYKSCNEFGQFQTYNNFFGTNISIGFYTQFCYDLFGKGYTDKFLEKGVRRTNVFYGGLDTVVSNVIFVHGDKDPYRKLGIINNHQGTNSVTHILKNARHCDELDDFEYTRELAKIKEEIYKKLMEWILDKP